MRRDETARKKIGIGGYGRRDMRWMDGWLHFENLRTASKSKEQAEATEGDGNIIIMAWVVSSQPNQSIIMNARHQIHLLQHNNPTLRPKLIPEEEHQKQWHREIRRDERPSIPPRMDKHIPFRKEDDDYDPP